MKTKIEPYFSERENERLYKKVHGLRQEQREQYLERVANLYIAELNCNPKKK